MDDFKTLLKLLVETPQEFTPQHASQATLLLHSATQPQLASYLTALKLSSLDYTPSIIASTAQALLTVSVPLSLSHSGVLGDIVGTGGDGQSTFNVSTAAAIIASASGLKVAKVAFTVLYYTLILKPCGRSMGIDLPRVPVALRTY
jgi:anthranilate phosphoribosyltransferase